MVQPLQQQKKKKLQLLDLKKGANLKTWKKAQAQKV